MAIRTHSLEQPIHRGTDGEGANATLAVAARWIVHLSSLGPNPGFLIRHAAEAAE
jgi:hypothetical protein